MILPLYMSLSIGVCNGALWSDNTSLEPKEAAPGRDTNKEESPQGGEAVPHGVINVTFRRGCEAGILFGAPVPLDHEYSAHRGDHGVPR